MLWSMGLSSGSGKFLKRGENCCDIGLPKRLKRPKRLKGYWLWISYTTAKNNLYGLLNPLTVLGLLGLSSLFDL